MNMEDNVPSGAAPSHATIDDTISKIYSDIIARDEAPVENVEPEEKTQTRDLKGKFAKSETFENVTDEAEKIPNQGNEETDGKVEPETAPRPSWFDSEEDWKSLTPSARDKMIAAYGRLQADSQRGIQKYADRFKGYEELDAVLDENRKNVFNTRYGGTPQALKQLIAASDWLEKDPKGFTQYLIRQYGLNPQSLFEQQTQQSVDPTIAALLSKVNSLEQSLQQKAKMDEEQQMNAVQKSYEAFVRDPNNKYVDDVRQDMAALLDSGVANSLDDAYQKAIWANESVRAKLLQEKEEAKRLEAEERARKALKASSNVMRGGVSGVTSTKQKSMDDTIAETVKRIYG